LGQIYETVLGWAGLKLGLKFATPIFDGASLEQINNYMETGWCSSLWKMFIFMMVVLENV
jgi:DNA-directed RNA polymerase subunit beta